MQLMKQKLNDVRQIMINIVWLIYKMPDVVKWKNIFHCKRFKSLSLLAINIVLEVILFNNMIVCLKHTCLSLIKNNPQLSQLFSRAFIKYSFCSRESVASICSFKCD